MSFSTISRLIWARLGEYLWSIISRFAGLSLENVQNPNIHGLDEWLRQKISWWIFFYRFLCPRQACSQIFREIVWREHGQFFFVQKKISRSDWRYPFKVPQPVDTWEMPKIGFWENSALIWQEYSPETRRKLFRHEINHLQTTKTCFPPCFEQIYRSICCEISQISQNLKVWKSFESLLQDFSSKTLSYDILDAKNEFLVKFCV